MDAAQFEQELLDRANAPKLRYNAAALAGKVARQCRGFCSLAEIATELQDSSSIGARSSTSTSTSTRTRRGDSGGKCCVMSRDGFVCGGVLEYCSLKDNGTLLMTDKTRPGDQGIPVVLNEACRLQLPGMYSESLRQLTVFTKWTAVLIALPQESDSLVAGFGQSDDELGESCSSNWPSWPYELGSLRYDGRFYLEVDDLVTCETVQEVGEQASGTRKRRRVTTLDAVCAITAVGPVTAQKAQKPKPYFFAECTILHVRGDATDGVQIHSVATLLFSRHAVSWHAFLQPNDIMSFTNVEYHTHFQIGPSVFRPILKIQGRPGQLSRGNAFAPYLNNEPAKTITSKGDDAASPKPGMIESYEGRLTRRVGAFVLEMDDKIKVFLPHVPLANSGRGLRVGALVRLYNVGLLRINGRLEGFVLTFRSTYEILAFSSGSSCPFVGFSRTLQKLLAKMSAPTAFWIMESLGKLLLKFESRLACKTVTDTENTIKELLALRSRICGPRVSEADDRFQEQRSVQSEFVDGQMEWLLPVSIDKASFPLIASVGCVISSIQNELLKRSAVVRNPSNCFNVSGIQGHGVNTWMLTKESQEMTDRQRTMCLIGWAATLPRTGQLCLKDKTGHIELNACASSSVRETLLRWTGQSWNDLACICLNQFRVVVQLIALHGLPDSPLTLDLPRLERTSAAALWSSQYLPRCTDKGDVVLRVYVESIPSLGQPGTVPFVSRPRRLEASFSSLGSRQKFPHFVSLTALVISVPNLRREYHKRKSGWYYGVTDAIKVWSSKVGGFATIHFKPYKTEQPCFPRYWSCLRPGTACTWEGLRCEELEGRNNTYFADQHSHFVVTKEATRQSADLIAMLNGPPHKKFAANQGQQSLAKQIFAEPVSVSQLFESGANYPLGRSWSFQGIISAVSLVVNHIPSKSCAPVVFKSSTLTLEVRAMKSAHTILCYVNWSADRYLQPGSLRVGAHVVVRGATIRKDPKRGVNCQITQKTGLEVVSVPTPNVKDPLALPSPKEALLPKCTFLNDILLTSIREPGKVHFAHICFRVTEVRWALFQKRCSNCGREIQAMDGSKVGCSGCDNGERGEPHFEIAAKFELLIEDGSAQVILRPQGEVLARFLGAGESQNSTWDRICELLNEQRHEPKMVFNPKQLEQLDDFDTARSVKARIEDEIIAIQNWPFQRYRALVKFHPNVRKAPKDSKPSIFRRGSAYQTNICLAKDIFIESASLPQVQLVPLSLEKADPLSS